MENGNITKAVKQLDALTDPPKPKPQTTTVKKQVKYVNVKFLFD